MQNDQLIRLTNSSSCNTQIVPAIWWTHAQCPGYSLTPRRLGLHITTTWTRHKEGENETGLKWTKFLLQMHILESIKQVVHKCIARFISSKYIVITNYGK